MSMDKLDKYNESVKKTQLIYRQDFTMNVNNELKLFSMYLKDIRVNHFSVMFDIVYNNEFALDINFATNVISNYLRYYKLNANVKASFITFNSKENILLLSTKTNDRLKSFFGVNE